MRYRVIVARVEIRGVERRLGEIVEPHEFTQPDPNRNPDLPEELPEWQSLLNTGHIEEVKE